MDQQGMLLNIQCAGESPGELGIAESPAPSQRFLILYA